PCEKLGYLDGTSAREREGGSKQKQVKEKKESEEKRGLSPIVYEKIGLSRWQKCEGTRGGSKQKQVKERKRRKAKGKTWSVPYYSNIEIGHYRN
ncbi:hypothetical protein, partial [Stutzerimonas nitrititolerans]|uniref:hypothetical protein n=1 Tax=Stutzerimonas nitrititolerans TaxID=2482751 RepID=UPI0028A6964B